MKAAEKSDEPSTKFGEAKGRPMTREECQARLVDAFDVHIGWCPMSRKWVKSQNCSINTLVRTNKDANPNDPYIQSWVVDQYTGLNADERQPNWQWLKAFCEEMGRKYTDLKWNPKVMARCLRWYITSFRSARARN